MLTSRTIVVNLKHEPFDVYIGRAGRGYDGYFGNPFRVDENSSQPHGAPASRQEAIEGYRGYFIKRVKCDLEFRERVLGLRGKRLGCFCPPLRCHGDVIVDLLDRWEPSVVHVLHCLDHNRFFDPAEEPCWQCVNQGDGDV